LTYRFDWGDGNVSAWGGAFSRTHAFSSVGTYCIKAQSQDSHGAASGWSACLDISIDIEQHTITASAGANGSISPAGPVTVSHGADQLFSISPNQSYRVADVLVDGSSVGGVTTYTFNSVDSDHTIAASFVADNQPPVSNAGADQTVRVSDAAQLDGSSSSDPNGDSLTYSWSFISRPTGSSATLSNANAVKPTFVADVAGSYTVRLIVNDCTVNSAPDTVTISTVNSAPVANAGADQTVLVTDTVQLDGSGSSDVDGDALTFKWSFVSRPAGSLATLSDTNVMKPSFMVDVAGTYVVQLIVNDGTANSAADTVTISTGNSAPLAIAGSDQTAEEGITVLLSGSGSTDPDQNIIGYVWEQTGGTTVTLSTPDEAETSFVAPEVLTDGEKLTFTLTVRDAGGLSDVDACVVEITKPAAIDSDGDGVPDVEDAFPLDPNETMDTDGDGLGNNSDEDDDNDGMPDAWEIAYGLNPLKDDAADDPDGDGTSNINEYNLGSQPNYFEGNIKPDAPELLAPTNNETVGLTPLLRTGEYSDVNANDVHRKTQWKVIRAFDNLCVLDVISSASLTAMTVPRQILEANSEYIWKARFFDSHDTPSDWSADREFITTDVLRDLNENGVPDDQEIQDNQDLDLDGTADIAQDDMRCVDVAEKQGRVQMCISIRNGENAYSIVSLEAEDPADSQLVSNSHGKPNFIEFGLLDFKVMVDQPGDETTVTIYLSRPAYIKGNCFKYDPVEGVWLDYSGYTEFTPNRKVVYLTIKDGGFGDADGIANGVIVDPLAFGSETDPYGGSPISPLDDLLDGVIPENLSCFISAAAGNQAVDQPASGWRHAWKLGIAVIAMLLLRILSVLFNPDVAKRSYRRVKAAFAKYRC